MRRILIVRTDRIGDVVLSTPVIKAVRDAYPDGFIGMMVSSCARDIVDGNPYLDEVIVFDKKRFGGIFGAFRFSAILRNKNFDTALILHPVKRVHIILWLAGIKKRVGLDKKWAFLLTDKLPHTKQLGQKHEIDYNLEIAAAIGADTGQKNMLVPVKPNNRLRVENILKENGLNDKGGFVVMHPGASCPSKRWPAKRFAAAADTITERFNKKVIVVAGANDKRFAREMSDAMENEALDLSGDLSVGELSALLEKAGLLISNDSGPVHMAVALGVPVVAIFGRSEPGLSPRRWGPAGKDDIILHKDLGCSPCLAHECKEGFKCLTAIEPEEVVEAAGKLLRING